MHEKRKYGLAIVDYTTAIEIESKFIDAYFGRGFVYTKKVCMILAIADYTKATEIDSNVAEVYCSQGYVYAEKEKI